jgi:hypothetical protein
LHLLEGRLGGPSRQPNRPHGQLTVVESRCFVQRLKQGGSEARNRHSSVRPPCTRAVMPHRPTTG